MTTTELLQKAKSAKKVLLNLSTKEKKDALVHMAQCLLQEKDKILQANKLDLDKAKTTMSDVKLDRLLLNDARIESMAKGMLDVSELDDPVGIELEQRTLSSGLILKKMSCPIGVIAIIYESRPNVTSDAASLCFMSGNVCILRSGKEAYETSHAIVSALQRGICDMGLPKDLILHIEDTSRESAKELMNARGFVDLLIPRGGKGLIQSCVENATVPCVETGTGICSIFVDEDADLNMALNIIDNAKNSRPSVCNAEETLLVHEKIAKVFLPKLKKILVDERKEKQLIPTELRLDGLSYQIIDGTKATEEDFDTEFLDYILAIKIVKDYKEAVEHIETHSTHHSEAIISSNEEHISYFTQNIDSAAIYINASTRFTDGGEFGLGCEMGISTQKLHCRGPMGLKELTTYKYIIRGKGQIR